MKPKLDILKTVQAIAVLLRTTDRTRLEYLSLLKMLYLADRESLAETGTTITDDAVVAMENGPVLSEIYDLIYLNHWDLALWTSFLHRDEYDLELTGDPGVDHLSAYEIRKLEEIARRYERYSWRELVEETHRLPEWQWHRPDRSHGVRIRPIPFKDILKAVGREADAESIMQDREAIVALEKALGR
ncbi:MAG TPA: Panacea domain-containing protein [Gemmataceae bacterium]|jgi:uncharacterized phage-associated protein|nr:Panacea domain-containing protein [Gemmataceae bacterium]